MEPANIRFGGGATVSLLHPLVAVWVLIAIVLIFTLPRQKVIVPFLLAFFTIPLGQVVLLGPLHFPILRILIFAGLVRMAISRKDASASKLPGGFNSLDQAVVLWTVSALIIVSLQWMELQAFIKFFGDFLDTLGGYLVMRFLIPDHEATRRMAKVLALICLIHAGVMINEQITHIDVFGYLGGGQVETTIRDGHVRAGGLLGTIQSGVFAGVLIPVFAWLWTEKGSRLVALVGIVSATAMVVTSFTSTSYMAYGASLMGLAFWYLRKQMRLIRWGFVAMLVALHLVMHGPVWSLIEKIDLTSGSSSYHRYMLIDTLIRNFGEWWLLGTKNNAAWGWEMWDTCNQFVAVAVTGGLLTLIFYILVLKRAFRLIGNARKQVSDDRKQEWYYWCLGSALFANVVAQFGINYMIQLELILFPLLACICVASVEAAQVAAQKAGMMNTGNLASNRGSVGTRVPLGAAG
jgi:hypothetical protein